LWTAAWISKGAAFEYFVRATLKGKKLGQYFTPRQVVRLMSTLVGREKIYNSLRSGEKVKVLDPACGTGGFLVYLMQECVSYAERDRKGSKITAKAFETLTDRVMQQTFFGSDANEGVACAAKMNMIIAGDGHTNLQAEDSLSSRAANWKVTQPDCDVIITNPPFGTSETESLQKGDWSQYDVHAVKGQQLFLQKMLSCTVPGGDICSVIDDDLLNTGSARELRKAIFQRARVRAVVRLPEETFKPNKINVRSSVLLLQRHEHDDMDLDQKYEVTFVDIKSLGYQGSGDAVRGFDFEAFLKEIEEEALKPDSGSPRAGTHWRAFEVDIDEIARGDAFRLDLKYWEPETVKKVQELTEKGAVPLKDINRIKTRRGKSPKAESYVDEKDGFALVVKAGTNITKFGRLLEEGDFIEKDVYEELEEAHLEKGDVLISSTGTGTLGKACVFDSDRPAIADGHVTILRVNPNEINPYYLADYLRVGGGRIQIERLYTGSTGLIELQPEEVDQILVDMLSGGAEQATASKSLRAAEVRYEDTVGHAEENLTSARNLFARPVHLVEVKVA
jgi:type I restriction enzyme M protein